MENKKIKDCPFCGGTSGMWWTFYRKYFIKCWICKAQTKEFNSEAEAIDAWNRREK